MSCIMATTVALAVFCSVACCTKITDENLARQWLREYDVRGGKLINEASVAEWNYVTNLTEYNQKQTVEAGLRLSEFRKEVAHNTTFFDWESSDDPWIKRQFRFLSHAGVAILPPDEVKRVDTLRTGMEQIYSTAKICRTASGDCLNLEPDLTRMFANSSNWDDLAWAWKAWRDATGKKMKRDYVEQVKLLNKAARLDGYHDEGNRWRAVYEMDDFKGELERMWLLVKPLYQNLHAYVRRRLAAKYADHEFPSSGHIPAHIMGNMWAQGWGRIFHTVAPYKGKGDLDVTDTMKRQGYNVTHMFRLAEKFFKDLGLPEMTHAFWSKSLLTKPTDNRRMVCHASAWDFHDSDDFRIKMCTDLTMDDLVTIHHEMGHIEYQMLYKDQPLPFRDGANPGFHEAVGDVMALSVSTPEHLHKIGLIENITDDREFDINFLMKQGLAKVGFLPFGYLIDQWRWGVFSGATQPDEYNYDWWQLRCKYQGVSPPVTRNDDDFDPGAKYHIPASVPYIRYFISYVIQFQFHRALCKEAGHNGPLHKCDIGGSAAAGAKLRNMLEMGSLKPWPDAMQQITGQRAMDAGAMMEYFEPLTNWLEEQNKGHPVGWEDACPKGSLVRGSAARGATVTIIMLMILASFLFW